MRAAFTCVLLAVIAGAAPSDDVRIESTASAERVYVGQRVTIRYSLVREGATEAADAPLLPIRDLRLVDSPHFDDLWVSEIAGSDTAPASPTDPLIPLGSYRLFPLREGRATVRPPEFAMTLYAASVEQLSVGPMKITRRAQPIVLDVVPIPTAGRPATFGGAVGQFSVRASIASREIRVGDAARIEVEIRGDGNLEMAGAPVLDAPDGVRVGEPRRTNVNLGLGGVEELAVAHWTIDVVPLRAGKFDLGHAMLDVFDPASGRFSIAQSDVLSITARDRGATADPTPAEASTSVDRTWMWWSGGAAGLVLVALACWVALRTARE